MFLIDSSYLEHHGVKGMRWGVRKNDQTSSQPDWSISDTGEINIKKGATLSRIVRNHNGLFGGKGVALDSGQPIYASFKPNDMAAYEHFFGRGKSLLVRDASAVLKLEAKTNLKAPGPKEAVLLYLDVIKNDPIAQKMFYDKKDGFSTKKQMDKVFSKPDGRDAYEVYTNALDSGNYNEKFKSLNAKYFEAVKKAGYNMLLDPADASSEFDAPVMILDGKKSLGLKSQHVVDKLSAHNARLEYKQTQIKSGKAYLESLGMYN